MSALVTSADAGIFAALKDDQLFQQASIELGAITWPNDADLDPVWVHEEISKNKTWSVPGYLWLPKLYKASVPLPLILHCVSGGISAWRRSSG